MPGVRASTQVPGPQKQCPQRDSHTGEPGVKIVHERAAGRVRLLRCYTAGAVASIRATVANGRVVVDEATDLPDGTEVELVVVMDHDEDDLGLVERRALSASLARAAVDIAEGRLIDGDEVMNRLSSPR